MSFPVLETVTPTNAGSSDNSPNPVIPWDGVAGKLMWCLIRTGGIGGIGWPAGWTELRELASIDTQAFAYHWTVAGDPAAPATITLSSGLFKYAALAGRVSGAENPATQAPEMSANASGNSATPDPATCTPTGGAKDYLWLWLGGWEGIQTSPPAGTPSADYSNPQGANTGVASSASTNCRVAMAERALNAPSENPPSWTISAADDWIAWTVAIHPGAAVAPTVFPQVVMM